MRRSRETGSRADPSSWSLPPDLAERWRGLERERRRDGWAVSGVRERLSGVPAWGVGGVGPWLLGDEVGVRCGPWGSAARVKEFGSFVGLG